MPEAPKTHVTDASQHWKKLGRVCRIATSAYIGEYTDIHTFRTTSGDVLLAVWVDSYGSCRYQLEERRKGHRGPMWRTVDYA